MQNILEFALNSRVWVLLFSFFSVKVNFITLEMRHVWIVGDEAQRFSNCRGCWQLPFLKLTRTNFIIYIGTIYFLLLYYSYTLLLLFITFYETKINGPRLAKQILIFLTINGFILDLDNTICKIIDFQSMNSIYVYLEGSVSYLREKIVFGHRKCSFSITICKCILKIWHQSKLKVVTDDFDPHFIF